MYVINRRHNIIGVRRHEFDFVRDVIAIVVFCLELRRHLLLLVTRNDATSARVDAVLGRCGGDIRRLLAPGAAVAAANDAR